MLTAADLSPDQAAVYFPILDWIGHGRPLPSQQDPLVLTLGGFAGTGKSSILAILGAAIQHDLRIIFCTITGKAAGVLRRKLVEAGVELDGRHVCGTVHSIFFRAFESKDTKEIAFEAKDTIEADLIVLDEASMVPGHVFHAMHAHGVPILAVGDHGQLPPVMSSFSLMDRPDLRLEQIHRQAAGSPIIQLSADLRDPSQDPKEVILRHADGKIIRAVERKALGAEVTRFMSNALPGSLFDRGIITYTNKLRCTVNRLARKARFTEPPPHPVQGEQVICLKNAKIGGDFGPKVFNGMRGLITEEPKIRDHQIVARLEFPEEGMNFLATMSKYQFGEPDTFTKKEDFEYVHYNPPSLAAAGLLFDYGYCATAHKMQGSQFSDVLLCYERPSFTNDRDFRKWVYTAVTRASERLTICWRDEAGPPKAREERLW